MGTVRQRFFAPRVRVKSYEELNAWLIDRCIAWARAHRHPEVRDKTIWEMPSHAIRIAWGPRLFEAERPSLVPYAGRFDGFHAVPAPTPRRQAAMGPPASVSKTCLVRFDNNRYSVTASAVGRPVEIRAYAERIEFRQDGRVVG